MARPKTSDETTPAAAVLGMNGEVAESIRSSLEAAMKSTIALQEEIFAFANHRLQTNTAAGEALLKCKTFEDAAAAQRDWARATTEDYMQEANKLMQMTREGMQQAVTTFIPTSSSK
ncbi:MAG: hypothetical protein GC199_06970 [Alphaproteobacteria bacterium]|nr:hypothetical protein [Alphaproteobacteria bacterium]